MTLIICKECGRAVSDKASSCVGCGAPLPRPNRLGAFNLVPEAQPTKPPTPGQVRRRALLSLLALLIGIIGSSMGGSGAHRNQVVAVVAALLLIGGLCGLLVSLVHNAAARNAHRK